jgi:hypothetical protein
VNKYTFPDRAVLPRLDLAFDCATRKAAADACVLGIGAYYIAAEDIFGTSKVAAGWLFRPGSLWIGAHWSKANRRWCINLLPMVTLWVCLKGGKRP